jgi:hypothetical protein
MMIFDAGAGILIPKPSGGQMVVQPGRTKGIGHTKKDGIFAVDE